MNSVKSKTKKIVLFSGALVGVGGAERLLFKEASYFQKNGFETHILTFNFREEVLFNHTYKVDIEQIGHPINSSIGLLANVISGIGNIFVLRRKIRQIKPDIILLTNYLDCLSFYFATMFTPYCYAIHIHGTMFWFETDLIKYAFIHRKVFNEIRGSVVGHKEFIPATMPKANLGWKIVKEIAAVVIYAGMKKAKKVFVLSNQMKWEVKKLYGKDAIILKAAFLDEIFDYKPKQDIKKKLGLGDKKMILNVNRLEPRKRVDLLIKAFNQVIKSFSDVVLVIGGVGPDEVKLKSLAKELGLADKVKFVGYIEEEELWDYFAACDIFAHPNWADFSIAACEPLALQKKVVWSTEMERDEHLARNKHIFTANPTVDDFAQVIKKALIAEVTEKNDLSIYTWNSYCGRILKELREIISNG